MIGHLATMLNCDWSVTQVRTAASDSHSFSRFSGALDTEDMTEATNHPDDDTTPLIQITPDTETKKFKNHI